MTTMIVTAIAALIYTTIVRCVLSGKILMVVTDCILLMLSVGVFFLSVQEPTGKSARPKTTHNLHNYYSDNQ
ncbi:MAG: hypothetical protein DRP45_01660 [Candidatus Zixiibacteriota bacterium]|nr:MAG: hypothetical protein DRP45_01660 [candidate division Zixibacteria bacterium]